MTKNDLKKLALVTSSEESYASDLGGAIADRVLNPILGVRSAMGLITDAIGSLDSPLREELLIIQTAAEKSNQRLEAIEQYIVELRDYSRPVKIRPELLSVKKISEEVSDVLFEGSSLSEAIEWNISDEMKVCTDREMLRAIFRVLLSNALEAGVEERPLRVIVSSRNSQDSKKHGIMVLFEDDGEGIDQVTWEHIIKPFQSNRDAGTGLGLAIVNKYLEACDGYIKLTQGTSLAGACIEVFVPDQSSAVNSKNGMHSDVC